MHEPSSKKSSPLTTLQAADLYRMQVRELHDYAMFMLDPQGIVTSWNAGVERLLGYSEQEWVGQHASIIFTPEEKAVEVCEAEMQKASETGSATDIRWHRHKDGSEFFANGFHVICAFFIAEYLLRLIGAPGAPGARHRAPWRARLDWALSPGGITKEQ